MNADWFRAFLVAGVLVAVAWAHAARAGEGTILGVVFDSETGTAVEGVSVSVLWPAPAGSEPRKQTGVTNEEGTFEFSSIPAGTYRISFSKAGYRLSTMTGFIVYAGALNRADFPLPPLPREEAGVAPDVEEFVVVASPVEQILAASRQESDELINTMSSEELSKFAASDVADALKFVPGVNVVEGQFAIIRGLEDRYSSTLYNTAPIPSPDPDRQSVQLDLFPSDVVKDLVVSKTFAPNLPSNSSGGSIDILTLDYPEEFELKFSPGTGLNENAADRFLEFQSNSPIGREVDSSDVIESEFGISIGGRREAAEREFRLKVAFNREIDYDTAEGTQEGHQPNLQGFSQGRLVRSGDLALGKLSLSNGHFDLTESERAEQDTGYLGFGFDLDTEGNHRIDASGFYTHKQEEIVQLLENGYLPNFDYSAVAEKAERGEEITRQDFMNFATLGSWITGVRANAEDLPDRGPLWFTSFYDSSAYERDRDLLVYQANGDHRFELLEGLHASWAANQARTTQEDSAQGAQYFYEPDEKVQSPTGFPTVPSALGNGVYAVNEGVFSSSNDIEEKQDFARLDADYEIAPLDSLTLKLTAGGWYEFATRDVSTSYLESPSVAGSSDFVLLAADPDALGRAIQEGLDKAQFGEFSGLRLTTNDSEREIDAWSVGAKATFWEQFDLLGGYRFERIFIESLNDPFLGGVTFDGSPLIYPSKYLMFDRLDNPAHFETGRPPGPGATFNDEILGIDVPIDPVTGLVDLVDKASIEALVNGEIDETRTLPSMAIAYRPIEGLALRGAYSQTVARPSFREMGYYVSVEPASDDLVIGNPQLQLSDVESFDTRVEYFWGDLGDLAAVSAFHKNIDDPIESIVIKDALSGVQYRTFFNNGNDATLKGMELEARKNLGFLGPEFAQYFSIGGNFTYIDAEVDRSAVELGRSKPFFGVAEDDADAQQFAGLEKSRRLFGQPEWIANADISLDHPDWGSKITLAYFAISDVLDAAGSVSINRNGSVRDFTLDRYVDSFYQLDLVMSQTFQLDVLFAGEVTFKASVKNLTDSRRAIIYDPDQTHGEIDERSYRVGRDLSVALKYTLEF